MPGKDTWLGWTCRQEETHLGPPTGPAHQAPGVQCQGTLIRSLMAESQVFLWTSPGLEPTLLLNSPQWALVRVKG